MKLSNQNIYNLRGRKNLLGRCQMPLGGGANNFWGGAHPPAPPQKIRACYRLRLELLSAIQYE
jgi:hypothetical protein